MKIVIDSNRVIAALIKESTTRGILFKENFNFLALDFIQIELHKYRADIIKKASITKDNIREAIQKGAKRIREDESIIAEFRWFKVIYREFLVGDTRKIYPITVID